MSADTTPSRGDTDRDDSSSGTGIEMLPYCGLAKPARRGSNDLALRSMAAVLNNHRGRVRTLALGYLLVAMSCGCNAKPETTNASDVDPVPAAAGASEVREVLSELRGQGNDGTLLLNALGSIATQPPPELEKVGEIPAPFLLTNGKRPDFHVHPQGLARDDSGRWWVSAVEIRQTRGSGNGDGAAHLFAFSPLGVPAAHATMTLPSDGSSYHPGGLSWDENRRALVLALAPYRPVGTSSIYSIDIHGGATVKLFEAPDHLSYAAVVGPDATVVSGNWDARMLYLFSAAGRQLQAIPNPADIRYQDCQELHGTRHVILSGIVGAHSLEFGFDLVEVTPTTLTVEKRFRWSSLEYRTRQGLPLAQNPHYLWLSRDGSIYVLVAPDSQLGPLKVRPEVLPANYVDQPELGAHGHHGSFVLYKMMRNTRI